MWEKRIHALLVLSWATMLSRRMLCLRTGCRRWSHRARRRRATPWCCAKRPLVGGVFEWYRVGSRLLISQKLPVAFSRYFQLDDKGRWGVIHAFFSIIPTAKSASGCSCLVVVQYRCFWGCGSRKITPHCSLCHSCRTSHPSCSCSPRKQVRWNRRRVRSRFLAL